MKKVLFALAGLLLATTALAQYGGGTGPQYTWPKDNFLKGLMGGSGAVFPGFTDSDFFLYDNVDNTKKLYFQLSPLTTGVTRTLFVPDLLAGVTQTNKYLLYSGGSIQFPNTAGGSPRYDTFTIGNAASAEIRQTLVSDGRYGRLFTSFSGAGLSASTNPSAASVNSNSLSVSGSTQTRTSTSTFGLTPPMSSGQIQFLMTNAGEGVLGTYTHLDEFSVVRRQDFSNYGFSFAQILGGIPMNLRAPVFNGGYFRSATASSAALTYQGGQYDPSEVRGYTVVPGPGYPDTGIAFNAELNQSAGGWNVYSANITSGLDITITDTDVSITDGSYLYLYGSSYGTVYGPEIVDISAGAGTYNVPNFSQFAFIKFAIQGFTGDETIYIEYDTNQQATATFNYTVAPVAGNTVEVANLPIWPTTTYTFVDTVANDFEVKVGADIDESYAHLVCAVLDAGCTEGPGADYMASFANSQVSSFTSGGGTANIEYAVATPYTSQDPTDYQPYKAIRLLNGATELESVRWGDITGQTGYGGRITADGAWTIQAGVNNRQTTAEVWPQGNQVVGWCLDPQGCEFTIGISNSYFGGNLQFLAAKKPGMSYYPITLTHGTQVMLADAQDFVMEEGNTVSLSINWFDESYYSGKWVENGRRVINTRFNTVKTRIDTETTTGIDFTVGGLHEQRYYMVEGGYTVAETGSCTPIVAMTYDFGGYTCAHDYWSVDVITADPGGGSTLSDYKVQICGSVSAGTPGIRCEVIDGATPPETINSTAGGNSWATIWSIKIISETGGITDETIQVRMKRAGPTYRVPDPLAATPMVVHAASDLTSYPLSVMQSYVRLMCLDQLGCENFTFADESGLGSGREGVPVTVVIADASSVAGHPDDDNGSITSEIQSVPAVGSVEFVEAANTMNLDAATVTLSEGDSISFIRDKHRSTKKWVQTAKSDN